MLKKLLIFIYIYYILYISRHGSALRFRRAVNHYLYLYHLIRLTLSEFPLYKLAYAN